MKIIIAFFRLIRWANLMFIILTQLLFRYCIILPILHDAGMQPVLTDRLFVWLMVASVLIAAAGYIINDYFDLNIDRVNKPDKIVVEKVIRRRWTILWHWAFSSLGIVISLYISWKIRNPLPGLANIACVLLLWFYSTTFKKRLLIGNIIISLLTAWVVMVLYVCELKRFVTGPIPGRELIALAHVFRMMALYGGFAFISSLVREVVKDMEDLPGDARYHCRTMPIVWGINVSRVFVSTWLVVLIGSLLIIQVYALQLQWWWAVLYCLIFITLPLLNITRKLFKANTTADFHQLSNWIKLVMMTGIVSMIFFKLYAHG